MRKCKNIYIHVNNITMNVKSLKMQNVKELHVVYIIIDIHTHNTKICTC